ncbi:MAG: amidase [Dehalococcoidales bacterium]|nr:amidase [Dehalococcoidales bacterium]
MSDLGICHMSAFDMARAVKTKKLSPVEIMKAVFLRIGQLNAKVNAFCTLAEESAMDQAKKAESRVMKGEALGPLHGVPVSIKDLVFTKDIRTTAGSMIYENFIPEQDAIVVERLKTAGAIIIGKTNTSEFGWTAITANRLFGTTRNPWNLNLHAGGSSGGAAAATALGMGAFGIGGDAGGSIRIPASFCGAFGFKPSFGRVPQYPAFSGWETLGHTGPITRTVRDAALVMEVISGRDDRDHFSLPDASLHFPQFPEQALKGYKIAWSKDLGYARVSPEVSKVTEAAVKFFSNSGGEVEAASPENNSPEKLFSDTVGVGLANFLKNKLPVWKDKMDPALVRFIEMHLNVLATEYAGAFQQQLDYCGRMQSFFQKYDLLLTPTVAVLPFDANKYSVKEIDGVKVSPLAWMAFTYPFNVTGQPAATVPCGFTDDGLPVGLQIIGRRFDDVAVLKAAAVFEQISPWAHKRPCLE